MRSRRPLRYSDHAYLPVCKFVCGRVPIGRDRELFIADNLAIFLLDFLDRLMIHNLDTDRVVRLSSDLLVLTIRLYVNRWDTRGAPVRSVLQQPNVDLARHA